MNREPSGVSTRPHYRLDAWQQARVLVVEVYRATSAFPREELYGLTSQVRRAAVSVASNIAEGAARESTREFAHAVNLARGSVSELETQLVIAADLGYLPRDHELFGQVARVFMLVSGLHRSLRGPRT